MNGLHNAGRHIEYPGTCRATIGDTEWALGQGAERKDSVVVSKNQYMCWGGTTPVNMRARRAADNVRGTTGTTGDEIGEHVC
jgi:hypothetical protein